MLLKFWFLALSIAVFVTVCPGWLASASGLLHVSPNATVEIVAASQEGKHKMLTDALSSEPVCSDPIDLDGVVFETVVADREWVIPPNESGMYTPVKFGIRVTNNTQEPIRIALVDSLSPWLFRLNGTGHSYGQGSLPYQEVREFDYPRLVPGEVASFFLEGRLSWNDGQLVATGAVDITGDGFL
jgi:hypothetical protein